MVKVGRVFVEGQEAADGKELRIPVGILLLRMRINTLVSIGRRLWLLDWSGDERPGLQGVSEVAERAIGGARF